MDSLITKFSEININQSELNIPSQNQTVTSSNVGDVLQIVFAVFAAVAVIVIIYAGIQFMLSQGDPAKTNTARNTILYAAIGLGLSALSFTIVSFVIGKF